MPGPYSVFTPVHDPDVPGRVVGDAYMRPGEVRVAANTPEGMNPSPTVFPHLYTTRTFPEGL